MKKLFPYYFAFILIFGGLFTNCKQDHPNRVYFVNEGQYDKLTTIVPIKLSEEQTINVLFDTGAPYPALDSTFFATYLLAKVGKPDYTVDMGSAWASSENGNPEKKHLWYPDKVTSINICGVDIAYKSLLVHDMKQFRIDVDGILGLPKSDSTHVWELNFEHNYLEIHQANSFKIPQDAYAFPFTYDDYLRVQFPIFVKTTDEDTLTLNYPYLIDTGLTQDLVLFASEKEIDFFKRRDDAVLLATVFGGCRSRHSVEAKIFDNLNIEDMRIYVDENSETVPLKSAGIIGMNFLKRFNVFFDFSTQKVSFQPITNYERVIDPYIRRFYYSTYTSQDRRQFVLKIADTPNNYYKDAGLKDGDEIVAINGHIIKSLTRESSAEIRDSNKKEMDILRYGKPLRITVTIDDKEAKGE